MQCNFCKEDKHSPAVFMEVDKELRVVNPVCGLHAHGRDTRFELFKIPFWSEKKPPTPEQLKNHEEYLASTWAMPILNPQYIGLKSRPMVGNRAR